jgi:hypothetical protein
MGRSSNLGIIILLDVLRKPFSIWVNCSKVIYSKKLLNTKISTARHCSSRCQKNETCLKIKKCHFKQMQVLDQNEQLLELRLLDKSIEKCQLLEL